MRCAFVIGPSLLPGQTWDQHRKLAAEPDYQAVLRIATPGAIPASYLIHLLVRNWLTAFCPPAWRRPGRVIVSSYVTMVVKDC